MSPSSAPSRLRAALFSLTAILLAPSALAQTPAPAPTGPVIELAPEDKEPPPSKSPPIVSFGAGRGPDADLVRSLTEQRFRSAVESLAHTSVGGYGELQVTGATTAPGAPREWTADARRLVIFVAHSFTQDIRVYTELELEHVTEAEIEQAYADWKILGDWLGVRAGLILVPMGITNEVHEPPIFNGVARPSVETTIIPTTWRELGIGFFGRPFEPLRYEVYAMAGLDPLGFSPQGFSGGGAEQSKAKAWAITGRVEYEPVLGAVLGASIYASDAGKNGDGKFFLKNGTPIQVVIPVVGYSIDARVRRAGLEAKALYTEWHLPNSGELGRTYTATDPQGGRQRNFGNLPLPTLMRGGYVELGYDVLHPARVSHQIVPFVRVEAYDTQAGVPTGYQANPANDVREVTVGMSYRPIREVVLKADYQLKYPKGAPTQTLASFGIGFMY